jgi:hypothetical protein
MIPTRSGYSGHSYKLFTDYNDIHIFVEDSGFENLYFEIFKRSEIRIRQVFSLNGKTSVVEAARNCNDSKCIYIIDRDWDDLLDIIEPAANLVALDKYAIENYLIEYSGFRAIVLSYHPRKNIDCILNQSMFDEIVQEVSNQLRPLFECYATMQLCKDARQNCSITPAKFQMKNNTCMPDPSEINNFITSIGLPIPNGVRNYFAGNVLCDRGHGKYMMHYVWKGVCNISNTRCQLHIDSLLIRLAQTVNDQVFSDLYDKIKYSIERNNN